MLISIQDGTDVWAVANALDLHIRETRFNMIFEVKGPKRIKLKNIRLNEGKPYCGNHPFACDVAGGRRAIYLEGLDWVSFNDEINDVLDRLEVSANVKTAVCKIRKGRERRVVYSGYWINENNSQWNMDEPEPHWQDYCGEVAPDSEYPMGPGIYTRTIKEHA